MKNSAHVHENGEEVAQEETFEISLNEPAELAKNDAMACQSGKMKKGRKLPQIIAALGANMGAFAYGLTVCWSATSIPAMKKDEEFGDVSDSQFSWISSIVTLDSLAVCLPAGILVDLIGRRRMMILSSAPFVIGYLLIYFAKNVAMILAGRFIVGLCSGVFTFVAPIFIAETSEPKIRGILLSGYDYIGSLGILFQLIVGSYLSWRDQALLCSAVPIFTLAILFFVPESPRFLLSKGNQFQASRSLCWLRGLEKESPILVKEIDEINRNIEEAKRNPRNSICFQEFLRPEIRKAMVIGLMLFLFKVLTGMVAVLFYRIEIFESAHVNFDEHLSSIIIGIVDFVVSVCSAAVVDRFGRKFLMIGSEILLTLSLVALGGFFHVKEMDQVFARESLGWLPLTSLIIFITGYSLGMGSIPSSVVTEILPQSVRGVASSILTAFRWAMSFLVARFFKDLILCLGDDGGYWFFACCCLLGGIYIFIFVPETKGRSLEEIQLGFLNKNNIIHR